jgi:single-stranded-DNA-specific exonuclease
MNPELITRPMLDTHRQQLVSQGLSPVMARVLAGRGISDVAQTTSDLAKLLNPDLLLDIDEAARRLANAIEQQLNILIVADYDCDGATACAVAIRGLKMLGARAQDIDFLVPNRFIHGYGLTPAIAQLAADRKPDVLVTVDNGIASVEGVAYAQANGMQVIVTDHHLPGAQLATPHAMVNPNQPGCRFTSKCIAGVGVMFYVLLAVRAELKKRQPDRASAPLQHLLDLVALGTVADLVPLDQNNRILVACGLRRIQNGQSQAGLKALMACAGRDTATMQIRDFGFAIAPRLNAAGRMADMTIGIELLLTDSPDTAQQLAQQLDAINIERKQTQAAMLEQALLPQVQPDSHSLTVFHEQWHAGIVGLIASRLKELWNVPVFALAPVELGSQDLRGSGRSVKGVHLRDALDLVSKWEPNLLDRFGGHAMAAGISIKAGAVPKFSQRLNEAVIALAGPNTLANRIVTDGTLSAQDLTVALALEIEKSIWGQGFEEPVFEAIANITSQNLIHNKHSKIQCTINGQAFTAMRFFDTQTLPSPCKLVFGLMVDRFRANLSVTLNIYHTQSPP